MNQRLPLAAETLSTNLHHLARMVLDDKRIAVRDSKKVRKEKALGNAYMHIRI